MVRLGRRLPGCGAAAMNDAGKCIFRRAAREWDGDRYPELSLTLPWARRRVTYYRLSSYDDLG